MKCEISESKRNNITFSINTSSGLRSPRTHILRIAPHQEKVPVLLFQFVKTANLIDSDCYGDDDVGVGDGDFGARMMTLILSEMNSETSRFHGEPMPQLLGLGVLWALNAVRPVRTPRQHRRRVLDHRDRRYPWEGGKYVALRARASNLLMRMMLDHVGIAL